MGGMGRVHQWCSVIRLISNGNQGRSINFLMRYCLQVVIYVIWHERNIRRVEELSQPAACLISRLEKNVRNRVTSLRKVVGGKHEKTMELWFARS